MPTSALSSEQDLQRQLWRQQLRACRRALTDEQQKQAAIGLAGYLPDHPWLQHASYVALYVAADGELDPQLLAEVLHTRGKTLVLPLLHPFAPQQLLFQRYLPHMALQSNRLGILQPALAMNDVVPLFQIDVLLMPVVGFDLNGTRLGMGGGFYDRTLATLAAAERP
ncbi:MAG: 5-formyltetrahydrofolate cyclo-ligase [Ferrimonas sp.]